MRRDRLEQLAGGRGGWSCSLGTPTPPSPVPPAAPPAPPHGGVAPVAVEAPEAEAEAPRAAGGEVSVARTRTSGHSICGGR